jgi:hypothetical protein
MNKRFFHVVIFALFAGAGFASTAHELECEKKAGIVKLDATGNPLLDATGLPIFDVAPAAVLQVNAYPAAIGFRIGVHNLAADTSVVTSGSDPLLDALASKTTFGTVIGPGLSLAVNGRAEQVVVVTVNSQQQCLDLFKGGAMGDAPACQNIVENRFVVSHEAGSAECRSQVICATQPPPPVCDEGQHSCNGQCVSNSSVNNCGTSCKPCSAPPEHAQATCNGVACGFECDAGFVRSNGACVPPPAPGPVAPPTCDDTWQGVKKLGTAGNDRGLAIALDSLCNVHVTGTTNGALTSDANLGGYDAFLASLDRSGARYQTRQFGTAGDDQGSGVSIDAAGNRYVVWTSLKTAGPSSMVTKFDAAGNSVWTKAIGAGDTSSSGIVADAVGYTYAVGSTSGSPSGQTNAGLKDAFVTKLDPLGSEVWTRLIGSMGFDFARAVALDQAGNVYVAGDTTGDLGGTGNGGGGRADVFLAKLDNAGNILWIHQFGGAGSDVAGGVGVDADGNAYVGGSISVTVEDVPIGDLDVFLAKYDSAGNQSWFRQFGSSDSDVGNAVAVDAAGNSWIAGSVDPQGGAPDAFVAKYDSAGTRLWIQQFGSQFGEFAKGVVVDVGGNAYVTGFTNGDFGGPNAGGDNGDDAFVFKLDPNGNLTTPAAGTAGH